MKLQMSIKQHQKQRASENSQVRVRSFPCSLARHFHHVAPLLPLAAPPHPGSVTANQDALPRRATRYWLFSSPTHISHHTLQTDSCCRETRPAARQTSPVKCGTNTYTRKRQGTEVCRLLIESLKLRAQGGLAQGVVFTRTNKTGIPYFRVALSNGGGYTSVSNR